MFSIKLIIKNHKYLIIALFWGVTEKVLINACVKALLKDGSYGEAILFLGSARRKTVCSYTMLKLNS